MVYSLVDIFSYLSTLYKCPINGYLIHCGYWDEILFEIWAFHLTGCFSRKAHKPLNQDKRSKNTLWVWCHCNLACSVGFAYFAILFIQGSLSWYLSRASFPMCFLVFTKICLIISLLNKYPPCWSFKLAKSSQFKIDIRSKTGPTLNADMWLTNLPKAVCTTLSPLQM